MTTALCHGSEIYEGCAKTFILEEVNILIVRQNGKLFGYINSCPHIGVPLNWLPDQVLDDDGELIQCATHGALFLIESGECISGPCNGQHLSPITLKESEGQVFYLGSRQAPNT
ncbi:MAG: Rieske 2Fe-2S domain-containing protein [Agarilytica sp.]